MSGPVEIDDLPARREPSRPSPSGLADTSGPPDLIACRAAEVGAATVRRALPNRRRRTVGPWCFADHFGPLGADLGPGLDVGPHPHTGLQTVTWLFAGALVHRDSLGSEQRIRPGQLNLMSSGHGVAHAEEADPSDRGALHGVQLWLAQPETTRRGAPSFEHHDSLPRVELAHASATVLVGAMGAVASPARRDTDHVGVELLLRPGTSTVPLVLAFEYALLAVEGAVTVGDHAVRPGTLLALSPGRDELAVRCAEPSRAMLLGGAPFHEPLFMWWNFVTRSRDEADRAYEDWATRSGRFGSVASHLAPIEAPLPLWRRPAR